MPSPRPASQRTARSTSQRTTRSLRKPITQTLEAVDAPLATTDEESSPALQRATARSSQRRAISATAPPSPELIAAKRAQRKTLVVRIAIACGVAGILGAGVMLGVSSGGTADNAGAPAMQDAIEQAEHALGARRAEDARTALTAARKDAKPADQARLATVEQRLIALEHELTVEGRRRSIANRLAKLSESETDPEALLKDAQAFIANPVGGEGSDAASLDQFRSAINEVKSALPRIEAETRRRASSNADDASTALTGEVNALVVDERFGDALAKLEAAASARPAAVESLKGYVIHAAGAHWGSVRSVVNTRLADIAAKDTSAAGRDQAKAEIRNKLERIIERQGVPAHVDEAKGLLEKLAAP